MSARGLSPRSGLSRGEIIRRRRRKAVDETAVNSQSIETAPTLNRIRIAVIDDHPLFRETVVETLKSAGIFEIVGEGATAIDAIRVAKELVPDVMLLDVRLPGGGIQAAAGIVSVCPTVRIIMLTASESEQDIVSALRAGARGYILKTSSGSEVIEAARDIARGDSYVAPSLAARLLINRGTGIETVAVDNFSDLTSYEKKIVAHVSQGLSNKDVARRLNCTERTVKYHMTNIMRKLNVRNRVEAVLKLTSMDDRSRL
jgi:two-component system, NarL family, nitrate/nitrite response regulator NarL